MPLTKDLTKFTTATNKIVTYDSVDLLSGVSIIEFDAGETANKKVLTRTQFPSYYKDVSNIGYYTNFASAAQDKDYDITISQPIEVEGTAIISFSVYFQNGAATRTTNTLTLEIRHVDAASSETVLGTVSQLATPENDTISFEQNRVYSFSMEIAKTHFAQGDTLRFNLSGTQANNSGTILVFHDPANFITTQGSQTLKTSRLQIKIPVINTD